MQNAVSAHDQSGGNGVLVAVVLVAMMSLALCSSAMADITITNTNSHISIDGKTYTAYKLFDSTHVGDAYSYTMSTSSPFYSAALVGDTQPASGMAKVLWDNFTFTALPGDTSKVNVASKAGFDVRDFADDMQEYLSGITGAGYVITATASGETATIDADDYGYYLVVGAAAANDDGTDTLVSAVMVTNEDPSPAINPKADAPQLNKKITGEHVLDADGKAATAQVGSTVTFELDSNVPDLTGYSDYTYTISDTMSSGLSFTGTDTANAINGLTVTINGTTLVLNGTGEDANKSYTISHAVDSKSFSLTIPFNTLSAFGKGNPIVVTYSAIVNSGALTTDYENNTAHLTYSNSPYGSSTNETPDSKVYVIDVNIDVDKVAGSASGDKLSGAKFVLFKGATQPADDAAAWYHYNTTTNAVEWVVKASADEFTTLATGKLDNQFRGLEAVATGSTYGLLETVAPNGYNLLDAPVIITLTGGLSGATATLSSTATATLDKTTIDLAHNPAAQPVATAQVINNAGQVLPSTGGIGTTIFYVAGIVLVLGAAAVIIARRKAEQE